MNRLERNSSFRSDLSDSWPENQVAQALAFYLEKLDAGAPPDLEEFLRDYPDIQDSLRECLRSLQLVDSVAEQLSLTTALADDSSRATSLGDFRILREIGRGGMGVVYEAEQTSLGRRVALKVLPFAAMLDDQQLRRFKNEAHAAAVLQHPNIVSVFYVGCERGVNFYAMPLIEGRNLQEIIADARTLTGSGVFFGDIAKKDSRPPSATTNPIAQLETVLSSPGHNRSRQIAALGIQAAQALDYAHREGVIHRDIKPSNLLVDKEGKLWVTDFGLARIQGQGSTASGGQGVGTLRYMSPEQLSSERVIDHRTDVYSLGLTLYELATLCPAFTESDRPLLIRQILEQEPTPVCDVDSTIPPDLATIIELAISKEREHRYPSAQALADDLQRFLDQRPILARPIGRIGRVWRWYKRSPMVAGLSLAVVLLSMLLASAAGWLTQREVERRELAERDASDARWDHYLSDMHAGIQALELGDFVKVRSLLAKHASRPDDDSTTGFRGFEWRFLDHATGPTSRLTIHGQPNDPWPIAFSPDGRTIAITVDSVIRLHDAHTGQLLRTLEGYWSWANNVVFSPDGKLLAGVWHNPNNYVRTWEVETGRIISTCAGHENGITSVTFTRDNQRLITSSGDHTARIWRVTDGGSLHVLPHGTHSVLYSGELPDGKIVTVCADGRLRHWSTDSTQPLKDLSIPEFSEIGNFAMASDASLLMQWAHSGRGSELRCFDPETGRLQWAYGGIRPRITAAAISGRWIATGDTYQTVTIWDHPTHSLVRRIPGLTGRIRSLSFAPEGSRIACASLDGSTTIIDLEAAETQDRANSLGWPLQIVFDSDGKRIVSGNTVGDVEIWNAVTLERINTFKAHDGWARSVAFLDKDRTVVSLGMDGQLKWWNPQRGELPRQVVAHPEGGRSIVTARDGQSIITGGNDGQLKTWNAATGALERTIEVGPYWVWPLRISADGQFVAHGNTRLDAKSGGITLWNVESGQRLADFRQFFTSWQALGFVPGERQLVALDHRGNTAVRFDFAGQPVQTYRHGASIAGLTVSNDGNYVATAGWDNVVRLWDLESGDERAAFTASEGYPGGPIAFSPQSDLLVACYGQTVYVWRAPLTRH